MISLQPMGHDPSAQGGDDFYPASETATPPHTKYNFYFTETLIINDYINLRFLSLKFVYAVDYLFYYRD